jgi:hypothetical protein
MSIGMSVCDAMNNDARAKSFEIQSHVRDCLGNRRSHRVEGQRGQKVHHCTTTARGVNNSDKSEHVYSIVFSMYFTTGTACEQQDTNPPMPDVQIHSVL